MTINLKDTHIHRFDFVGATEFVASGSVSPIPFRKTLVGSATLGNKADGAELALIVTTEAESARLSFADILSFDIDDLISFYTRIKVTSEAFTNSSLFVGLASAGNATIDTIANMAGFRMDGTLALKAETDDNVNNVDDIAVGLTPASGQWVDLAIDFASGIQTVGPPGISKGGKGCVQFYAGTSSTGMRRRCPNQLFDMSNYTGGLQPYIQLQKASSADVATCHVDFIEIVTKGRN
jgi:hypothetical protein